MADEFKLKLQETQFLKSTGVLDGYENVIDTMVSNGWPSNSTIYETAAYELLKWHSNHKEQLQAMPKVPNPGQ